MLLLTMMMKNQIVSFEVRAMTNEEAIEVLKINYPKKCYIFFL